MIYSKNRWILILTNWSNVPYQISETITQNKENIKEENQFVIFLLIAALTILFMMLLFLLTRDRREENALILEKRFLF